MLWHWNVMFGISIHAPLRERPNNPTMLGKRFTISIHALSRERLKTIQHSAVLSVISIHAPLRERPPPWNKQVVGIYISIHAPLRERLSAAATLPASWGYFNPRSLTGATSLFLVCSLVTDISIHAPLRERHFSYPAYQFNQNFNPRSFTGATECRRQDLHPDHYFNPRSLTEATRDLRALISTTPISIHAPSQERLVGIIPN